MSDLVSLTAEDCGGLEPNMFIVNHLAGEKLAPEVQKLLDPPQMETMHYWDKEKEQATELHYHDYDEYWTWAKGRTLIEIRLPDGRRDKIEIGLGSIVYCVRGVEHGHAPLDDWGCFEWIGANRPDARVGKHLIREL